ncbi:MAG: glyoxalase [Candidatus Eisenbacteria bacterium]|uniref:Glyoxalase n=1 Tax=Eiseniibacteriota bacterium TaxID=2212470 RepID=A0A538SRN8_UNCEI|nr:MAG: glyoxalase [Candidatus Eisenbacteria bacterium]
MPRLERVLETSLYVADLARSLSFYESVVGLRRLQADERFCALEVPGRQVLLLFKQGGTLRPIPTPGGVVPPHDGEGRLHLAFAVPASELAAWESHLERHGVPIESRVTWGAGERSLYFRDPDGHLVELATPGLWWRSQEQGPPGT